jgi:alkylation response protein AidB-like acyl-CoA dehydrogenase
MFERFFSEWVRPRAGDIDRELSSLQEAMREMGRAGLLGARIPAEFGGLDLDDVRFWEFQEAAARASGALAFLQAQHQSASRFIARSRNGELRRRLLPDLASGKRTSGIAFSQLRRPGDPPLKAVRSAGGYALQGRAPWVTGWGLFDLCVTAAVLPEGDSVWVVHTLAESHRLRASLPLRLAALEVTQTVSVHFEGLEVPEQDVLYTRAPDWILENDAINLARQSPLILGCARGAVDLVRASRPAAADALESELSRVRARALEMMRRPEDKEGGLGARADAIELAGRCAMAAIVAASGAGNRMDHPAQRIYRETLAFAVLALTTPIADAVLTKLFDHSG